MMDRFVWFLLAQNDTVMDKMAKPIIDLLNMVLGPALGIVGAVGAIYCVLLGVKLAKAEEPQDQMKAKQALKNAIIGFLLIFVLLVLLRIGMSVMGGWMKEQIKGY